MKTIRRCISSDINKLSSNRPFMTALFSICSAMISQDAAARYYRKESDRVLSLASGVSIPPTAGGKR